MYTPNELKDISFDKAVFGGYDMSEVDKIFKNIANDYAELFKENTMLKKKLKLLADTVEDYRSVDEAMRKALITAQNLANEMVADAEKKCAEMLANASGDAKKRAAELAVRADAEEKRLRDAKAETAEFMSKIAALYDEEKKKISALGQELAPEEIPEGKAPDMEDTLEEIAKSVDEKLAQEEISVNESASEPSDAQETKEESESSSDDAGDTKDIGLIRNAIPTEEEMEALEREAEKPKKHRRVEFAELKFGRDYDMSNDK